MPQHPHHSPRSRHRRSATGVLALVSLLVASLAMLLPSSPAGAEEPSDGPQANYVTIAGLRSIEAGWRHTCGISDTRAVYCWGSNSYGSLGDGSVVDSSVPVAVQTSGTVLDGKSIGQIATGQDHTCALTTDDVVACWGRNNYGQLGNGTTDDSTTPVEANLAAAGIAGSEIVDLVVGQIHSCVLTSNSVVACWGQGGNGALGNGGNADRTEPTPITATGTPLESQTIDHLAAGGYATCAITGAAWLSCWGSNSQGALGDGTTTRALSPTQAVTVGTPIEGKDVSDVSVGLYSTCALASDGTLACTGRNDSGQLGNGTYTSSTTFTAVTTAGTPLEANPPLDIEGDRSFHCAIASDSQPVCWGDNTGGQLGTPTADDESTLPVAVTTAGTPLEGKSLKVIGLGWYHTCAIPADGQAVCWGTNSGGQLGTGDDDAATTPTSVLLAPAAPSAPVIEEMHPYDGGVSFDLSVSDTGGFDVSGYLVTPYIDGVAQATVATEGGSTWTFIDGLANGTTYQFKLAAINEIGLGAASVLSDPVVPRAEVGTEGSVYVPITPCRIVDTREAGGTLTNREIRDYQVTGGGDAFAAQGGLANGCNIPEGTAAIEASVTAVGPATSGFTRAWPAGESMPNATFMNFDQGMDITNTGAIPIATPDIQMSANADQPREEVRLRNFGGNSHYVIDIQGFYWPLDGLADDRAQTSAKPIATTYTPITPCRIVDTREAGGTLTNREIRDYQVTGGGDAFAAQGGLANGCNIPEGTAAIEASVTAVGPATSGFTRAWPAGESMPNATFMNFDQGMDITNTGAIPIATPDIQMSANADQPREEVRLRNFGGNSHYVIDIQGFYSPFDEPQMEPAAFGERESAVYVPITPCRIVDTREAGGTFDNREIRNYQVGGDGDAFAAQGGLANGCGISEDAIAIEGSVTAVGPATSGFTRAWPAGESMPNATFMNFDQAMDITNTGAITITPEGAIGPHDGTYDQVRLRNFGGNSQYVIDIQGYFVPAETRPV